MTAFHPNLKPPVGFDQGDEFADLHSAQFTPGTLDLRKKMGASMAMHVLRAQSAKPAPGPTLKVRSNLPRYSRAGSLNTSFLCHARNSAFGKHSLPCG